MLHFVLICIRLLMHSSDLYIPKRQVSFTDAGHYDRPGTNKQPLTHWGWDKMAAIFQTTSSNAFSWVKMNEISLFIPIGPINNMPALVQIMAWRRPGDKPLSEPMVVGLLTHICVTRPQWVNTLRLRQNGRHFLDDIVEWIFLKMYGFRSGFHWSLFLGVHWQYSSIGSDNGLTPARRQAIVWTNNG